MMKIDDAIDEGWLRSLKNRNCLITGGNGFQARWLTRYLLEMGCAVTGMVRNICPGLLAATFPHISPILANRVQYEVADIRDHASAVHRVFSKHKPDVVFHLAAQTEVGRSNKFPMETVDVNVMGSGRILEACRDNPPKAILFGSTDKFYGSGSIPFREDDLSVYNNEDIYSLSKFMADRLAQAYASHYGLNIRISRASNIFGPGQLNESTLLTAVIKTLLSGGEPYYIAGMDKIFREYTYIEDSTFAYLLLAADALENGLKGYDLAMPGSLCYNIGSGEIYTALAMIEMVIEIMGLDVKPTVMQHTDRGPEGKSRCISSLKLRQRFPCWEATPVRVGILETIGFYRNYWDKGGN